MPQNQPPKLVWRPEGALWVALGWMLFGILALGVFFFEKTKSLLDWSVFILYIGWTGLGLYGTLYGLRARVEADDNGVRWRDWRGVWRAAKWDEIRDFYKRTRKNEGGATHRVETAQGNFEFDFQGDGKALVEFIPQRALDAWVREWDIKGERLCDSWPRRFVFYPSGFASLTRNALLVLLAALGLTIYILWFRMPPRDGLPTSIYFLAYVAPPLVIPVVPFLFWLFFLVQERQARPFRGQSVEVSPTGLVWNGMTRVEASWEQIQTWSWKKRGQTRFLELQTARGNLEIPVPEFGFGALCRIIERFSGVPLLKMDMEETAVYPIPDSTKDTLVFDFNSVVSRLLSQIFLSMSAVTFLMPFLMRWADPLTPQSEEASVFVLGVVLIALSIAWIWYLRVSRLRLTRDNLEWHAPFFHRTVAWRNIDAFGSAPSGSGWIKAGGKRMNLSFLWMPVAQRSRLHAEIEKRAFNARGKWE